MMFLEKAWGHLCVPGLTDDLVSLYPSLCSALPSPPGPYQLVTHYKLCPPHPIK